MTLTWLGQACFLIESSGYRIVLDPYTMEDYPPLHVSAHQALCSHQHRDHNYVEAVSFLPAAPSPFRVETISAFHDDQQGALRGSNTIHILCAEGLRIVHLGDLGHMPSAEQLSALRGCDALLTPVGGFYTIDAVTAKAVADAIAPRVIVPMHYRHGAFGLRPVAEVDDFLRLYPEQQIHRLAQNCFTLSHEAPQGVVVPRYSIP